MTTTTITQTRYSHYPFGAPGGPHSGGLTLIESPGVMELTSAVAYELGCPQCSPAVVGGPVILAWNFESAAPTPPITGVAAWVRHHGHGEARP